MQEWGGWRRIRRLKRRERKMFWQRTAKKKRKFSIFNSLKKDEGDVGKERKM